MKNVLKRFGFASMLLGMLTLAPLTASAQDHNVSRDVDRNVPAESMLRRAPAPVVNRREVNTRSTNRGRNDRNDSNDRRVTPIFRNDR